MKRVLIHLDSDVLNDSLDLIGAADEMYGPGGYTAYGLCLGSTCENAVGVLHHLLTVSGDEVDRYNVAGIADCVEELHRRYAFDAILVPASAIGRIVAPRVAMRLHTGLVADVTEIRRREDVIELVRPAFSGRMLASIVHRGPGPVMISVRASTFSRGNTPPVETEVIPFVLDAPARQGVRLVARKEKSEPSDIRDSEILVAGGGGVLRHFDRLDALAKELNGMVAASRRVVDSGVAPRHIQVGQSGKTVTPRLYIAVGISGSIQHVVGVKSAEYVISVNSNRHAPICSLSDIVVEGDARDFADRMVERIQRDGMVPPVPEDTETEESI